MIVLLKEHTGSKVERNGGCIHKIHLTLGFRVDLSLPLHFGARIYVESIDYHADSTDASQKTSTTVMAVNL